MTYHVNKEQNEALANLNAALYQAKNSGLLEAMAAEVPETVGAAFYAGVGRFCTQAQPTDTAGAR